MRLKTLVTRFKEEDGQAIVLVALAMGIFLLGAIGLAVDGSILYTQRRLGRSGQPFTLYKFRTMRRDAERDGPRWASRSDDRATRFGRMLRATREDPSAASAVGISVYRQRLGAFVVSGVLAGLAGGLYVHLLPLNTPRCGCNR